MFTDTESQYKHVSVENPDKSLLAFKPNETIVSFIISIALLFIIIIKKKKKIIIPVNNGTTKENSLASNLHNSIDFEHNINGI